MAAIGQNVTIDYQAWNPSGTTCSLFVNPTNVPATGTTSGNIEHQRKLGETVYNSTDLSIQMQTIYQSTGSITKGARYRIAYSFKAGYSYMIYVTAAAVENTVGSSTGPFIRLDVNNNGGGGSTGCNGPETLNPNTGGNPAAIQLSSNSFQEFQFVFPALGVQPTLEVTAFPTVNGGTKTVRVRKIRIVETPPAVSFALAPASLNIQCGSTTPQIFTVTNVNNTPNVTDHTWNLGSTNNGWLYNGNPAPQTISTGMINSLTLTPACTDVKNNISATVTVGTTNYQTNSSSIVNTSPTLSISGSSSFCTGTDSYTVSGVPCNAIVSWTSSNTSIATIPPTGNPTTLTKVGNGPVTITATVSGVPCLSNNAVTKTVAVGAPQASNIIIWNSTSYTNTGSPVAFVAGYPPNDRCQIQSTEWQVSMDASVFTGSVPCDSENGTSKYIIFQSAGTAYVQARIQNGCGWSDWSAGVPITVNQGFYFTISPNPAATEVTVNQKDQATSMITEIKIFDNNGNLKKQSNYTRGTKQAKLNVLGLNRGLYFIEISSSQYKERQQLVIQK